MSEMKFGPIDVMLNVESIDASPEILVQMFEEKPIPPDDFRSSGGFGDQVQIEVVRGESQ